MAILRALDGKFYDLPDDALDQYLIPADQLKSKLSGLARGMQPGATGAVTPYAAGLPGGNPLPGGTGQPRLITTQAGEGGVVIQIYSYGGQGGGLGGAPPSAPPSQQE